MSHLKRRKEEVGIAKLVWDYGKDRRRVLLLFFVINLIFVIVCSLYQLHNLPRLLYAFLLSIFVGGCFAVFDLRCYIKKRQRILLSMAYPEQVIEALLYGNIQDYFTQHQHEKGRAIEQRSELDKAYAELIEHLNQLQLDMKTDAELKRTDMMNYYLMWVHQIKTPIAALKLLLSSQEESFALQEELFKIEQYVEMVLHYLRLESIAADMLLKEYDLHTLVKQTLRKYSVLFINSGLSLQLEEFEVTVLTDEKWLGFVLEQLISNSIKYTRKGTISIYMSKNSEKTLVIEDTGIGIRKEDIPRIFDRGFTGYNGRMDKKSTGIGLYLCKQILAQLSHGITVVSEEGKGCKVYLDLSRENTTQNAD